MHFFPLLVKQNKQHRFHQHNEHNCQFSIKRRVQKKLVTIIVFSFCFQDKTYRDITYPIRQLRLGIQCNCRLRTVYIIQQLINSEVISSQAMMNPLYIHYVNMQRYASNASS